MSFRLRIPHAFSHGLGHKRPSAVTFEFGDYLIDRQSLHKIQDMLETGQGAGGRS